MNYTMKLAAPYTDTAQFIRTILQAHDHDPILFLLHPKNKTFAFINICNYHAVT